ncbi:MAG: hypothetical protein ACI3VX_03900 [Faecousia sp.]
MKKMKLDRLIALFLIFAMACSMVFWLAGTAFAVSPSRTVYIDTVEDFTALAENCTLDTWSQGKTVVLRADLSLDSVPNAAIPIFSGVFQGNGHTISGLKLTRSATPAGLFGVVLEGGVIKNLVLTGVEISMDSGSNVGAVAGENHGTITGCSVTGSIAAEQNVGAIAGINASSGQIKNCSASGSVTGSQMTGGIAGSNLGRMEGCENSAYVNTSSVDPALDVQDLYPELTTDVSRLSSMDTGTAAADTGGIAGYSAGSMADCVNRAPVGYPHIGYNVGGVVGRSCGYLSGCENTSQVFGRKDVGGIVGQMEPYIAQNITESTLAKLERQLDELDVLLNTALDDANAGVSALSSRLSRIAAYADSAAGAASNIRTYGTVTGTADGSGEADASGSVTVTPPQVEADAAGEALSGGVVVTTPDGAAAGSGASASVEIQGGLTQGDVSGEGQSSASGTVNASTQISVTTSLGGLSSAIYGMSGQMRLLGGEMSGTSGVLTEDLKAIQKQINAISDTALDLFQGDGEGDILVDSSETEADLATFGKAADCSNRGSVSGDINVGGITGCMAMEYALDPEDDLSLELNGTQRRKLEVKAIVQRCINTGAVTAKRSYTGGICGRMDLGLITASENYGDVTSETGDYVGGVAGMTSSVIRRCFVKCTLQGEKNVGGIVGSGVSEDLTGGSSTVAGCYSMVQIPACEEFAGAISGVYAGNFEENYFVSDTLTGINGRSYTGHAEPIAYTALQKAAERTLPSDGVESVEGESAEEEPGVEASGEEEPDVDAPGEETAEEAPAIPEAFLQLTLTFVADGETVLSTPIDYGASYDESQFPQLPQKDGYSSHWDNTDLQDLRFDTVVTAVYTPYVTALAQDQSRADGRSIFFVAGQFHADAAVTVTALANTPEAFDDLATEWQDFLAKSFTDNQVCRQIVEQWSVEIPDDGQSVHSLRYLPPDGEPEHLRIYVKEDGVWTQAESETVGSYLVFSAQGSHVEMAALRTVNVWWVWLLAGLLALLLTALIVFLILKLVKVRKRASAKAIAESRNPDSAEAAEPSEAPAAPKRKKRWLTPLLVILALLAGIVGTAAFFLLPDVVAGVKAYDLLQTCAEKAELSMTLTVDGEVGGQSLDFTADVQRTQAEGRRLTAVSQGSTALYYCDGVVFLENGTACQLNTSYPDYSQLLELAAELYRHVEQEAKDGVYTVTAQQADAQAILALLMPDVSQFPIQADLLQVELAADGDTVSELRFSGSGSLDDGEETPFRLSAVLHVLPEDQPPVTVPDAVKEAVRSGDYEDAAALTEDLMELAAAWQALEQQPFTRAALRLKADCGPLALDDTLDYCRWNDGGKPICSVQKNGYALYFADAEICDAQGNAVQAGDAGYVDAAKLLELAYETCLHTELNCVRDTQSSIYTLSLDEQGMQAAAYVIAPEAESLNVAFESGSLELVLTDGQLRRLTIRCGGSVQVVLSRVDVVFQAEMEFTPDAAALELPQAVQETLRK